MNSAEDNYLWTKEGRASEPLEQLEHELGSLRWTPRPLPLPGERVRESEPDVSAQLPEASVTPIELSERRARLVQRRPALVAAVLAAAAVLALAWLRPSEPGSAPSSAPVVAPSPSPDLKDPFAPRGTERGPEPKQVAPVLVDPFADADPQDAGAGAEREPRAGKRRVSPDLKDPFAPREPEGGARGRGSKPGADEAREGGSEVSPWLQDPFADPSAPPPGVEPKPAPKPKKKGKVSPDLLDPFASHSN